MYYTYIIKEKNSNSLYKGHTQNLDKRIKEHNSGKTKSTRNRIWEIFHFETFDDRESAIIREKYFKSSAGRRWIKNNLF